jgi:hypothetical protein
MDSRKRPEPPPQPSHEQIAVRARLISQGSEAGTDEDNWLRAEGELTSAALADVTEA